MPSSLRDFAINPRQRLRRAKRSAEKRVSPRSRPGPGDRCDERGGGLTAMSNERSVLSDISDGLATLTLNKPAKLNAWDTPMRAEIARLLREWNAQERVRAVIVTGAGDRAFSAGQDLVETEKSQSGSDGANWFQSWRDFYTSIRNLDKPAWPRSTALPPARPSRRPC